VEHIVLDHGLGTASQVLYQGDIPTHDLAVVKGLAGGGKIVRRPRWRTHIEEVVAVGCRTGRGESRDDAPKVFAAQREAAYDGQVAIDLSVHSHQVPVEILLTVSRLGDKSLAAVAESAEGKGGVAGIGDLAEIGRDAAIEGK